MDKSELKALAYKEDLSAAMERNAELRVELTLMNQQLQEVMAEADELREYKRQREEQDGLAEQEERTTEDS